MTPFSALAASDFQHQVLSLLPRGRAFLRTLTTTLAALCGAIGDCFFQFHQLVVLFLDVESDPAQTNELLPDWEADYGLPDACTIGAGTLAQRRAALLSKIASTGGQSAAYLISVASALGFPISITTFQPSDTWSSPWAPATTIAWRFVWAVTAPTVLVTYTDAWGSPWDPLWAVDNTELACRLTKIAPAYSEFWINYG